MSITGTVPVKVPEKLSELELDAGGKMIENLGLGDTLDDAMRRSEKTGDYETYGLLAVGLAADRPAPGIVDRFYFSADTLVLERDTGVAWVEVVRGETAIRLAQLAEKAHSSLDGVGANDHHTKTTSAGEIISGIFAEARIPSHMSKNKLAWTANKILKGAGPGANPLEIDVPAAGIWTLLQTLSPSSDKTISTSSFSAHALLMMLIDLYLPSTSETANYTLRMRFNGDTGDNYDFMHVAGTAVINSSSQTSILIMGMQKSSISNVRYRSIAHLIIGGKTPGSGSYSAVGVAAMVGSSVHSLARLLQGNWECNGDNITQITFFCPEAFTGKIMVYYMDY